MNNERYNGFLRSLSEDKELAGLFATAPEGGSVPFKNSPTDRSFSLTFAMPHEQVTLKNISFVCQGIVRRFVAGGLTTDIKGINILVCMNIPSLSNIGFYERVLKFSVLGSVFQALPDLTPLELLNKEPTPGVWCTWYCDRDKIPLE
jgi:hypothetical protein